MIRLALAKPAIVHDEAVDAESRCFFSESHLSGLDDIHFGGFPGVVDHWAGFGCGGWAGSNPAWQDLRNLEVVEQPRCPTKSMGAIAAIKYRGLKRLAGMQHIAKIKW